jgi:hypothetical protein
MRSRLLYIAFGLILLSGCSMSDDSGKAEREIPSFHRALDAGEFQAIYRNTDKEFRNITKEKEFVDLLAAIHQRLGNVTKSEQANWNVNYGTAGTFVTINHTTEFEHGKATENFIYRLGGDRPRIVGYHIQSNDLILRAP